MQFQRRLPLEEKVQRECLRLLEDEEVRVSRKSSNLTEHNLKSVSVEGDVLFGIPVVTDSPTGRLVPTVMLTIHGRLQVRVRVAVGDCLQVLAQQRGAVVLEQCIESVLLSINEHYVSKHWNFQDVDFALVIQSTPYY